MTRKFKRNKQIELTPLYVFIVSFMLHDSQVKQALCQILSKQLNFSTVKQKQILICNGLSVL